ncbi:methyl-accepting chemotaxis protein [Paenibacillus gorillae]|uniref:methyl-accepting chemotaxis protein n=1 Tax=Paenibacillus gorillae TaxID=1243662 RepID=UPI00138B0EBA|nr:methyl-accepting chemotaxis protein [Paenibacillus gorillae]
MFSSIFFSSYLKKIIVQEVHTKEEAVVAANLAAIEYSIQRNISFLKEIIASNEDIKSGNVSGIIDYFKKLENSNKEVEQYVYVNKEDIAFTTAGQQIPVSERNYIIQAKATKQPVVTDLLVSKATGNNIIVIFVPILDEQNNFKGGVFSPLTTANLDVFTNTIKIGKSGFGYLLSPTGMLLTYPDPDKVGKSINEALTAEEVAQLEAVALKDSKGIFNVTHKNGLEQEISFDTIPSTGWRLLSVVHNDEVYGAIQTANNLVIWLTVVTTLVVAVIALMVSLSLTKPILRITNAVKILATGDLTPRISLVRKDELGELGDNLNLMVDRFSNIVGKASYAAERVAASSEELTATAVDLVSISNRIVQSTEDVLSAGEIQVQGAEQTSTAMGEMAAGVQRIAESSSMVTEVSQSSLQEVQNGVGTINLVVEQMGLIHTSVLHSAEDMRTLEAFSQQIGDIVSTISDITSQTQLLALNASIEAARAGEQGRGFAVVANEVKKLAEQSSIAAADIGNLIQEVQRSTAKTAEAMNKGVQDVFKGSELINEAGDVFGRISETFQHISNQIQEVSAASQEMSAGTEEVSASMSEMVSMTEGTHRHTQDILKGSKKSASLHGRNICFSRRVKFYGSGAARVAGAVYN